MMISPRYTRCQLSTEASPSPSVLALRSQTVRRSSSEPAFAEI